MANNEIKSGLNWGGRTPPPPEKKILKKQKKNKKNVFSKCIFFIYHFEG